MHMVCFIHSLVVNNALSQMGTHSLFSSAANGLGMVCVEKLEIDTAKEIFAKVMAIEWSLLEYTARHSLVPFDS